MLAAVREIAFSAGAALALACDRVVTAADAVFGLTFTGVGLAGDMGVLASRPARAGVGAARQLLMMPRGLTGPDALALGLAETPSPTRTRPWSGRWTWRWR